MPNSTNDLTSVAGDFQRAADANALLQAALAYAEFGLAVVPLHHLDSAGGCSCRKPKCPRKHWGKHPRFRVWQRLASTEPQQLRSWWQRWPLANVGLVLSPEHVVLDVDGPEGLQSLQELTARFSPLPVTALAQSGSGGLHHYFRSAEPMESDQRFLPGLDFLAEAHLVVAPPSTHWSGNRYTWLRPLGEGIADCPTWLRRILLDRQQEKGGRKHEQGQQPVTANSSAPSSSARSGKDNPGKPFEPGNRSPDSKGEQHLLDELLQRFPVTGPGQRNQQMVRAVGSLLGRNYSVTATTKIMEKWLEHQQGIMTTKLAEAKKLLAECVASTLRSKTFIAGGPDAHLEACRHLPFPPRLQLFLEETKLVLGKGKQALAVISPVPNEHLKPFLGFLPVSTHPLTPSRKLDVRAFIKSKVSPKRVVPLLQGKMERAFVAAWGLHCQYRLLHVGDEAIQATDEQIKALMRTRFQTAIDRKSYYALKPRFISRPDRPATKMELLRELVKGRRHSPGQTGVPSEYALTGLAWLLGREVSHSGLGGGLDGDGDYLETERAMEAWQADLARFQALEAPVVDFDQDDSYLIEPDPDGLSGWADYWAAREAPEEVEQAYILRLRHWPDEDPLTSADLESPPERPARTLQ